MAIFQISAFKEKFKPILCLTGFFKGNAHFRIKICFTLPSYCFLDISSNTCAALEHLLGKYILPFFCCQVFVHFDYSYSKCLAFGNNSIILLHTIMNYAL